MLQLGQHSGVPALRPVKKDADRRDPILVVAHIARESVEVVLGLVLVAGGVADDERRGDGVGDPVGDEEVRSRARIAEQELLERRIAEELQGGGEVVPDLPRQSGGERAQVAVGDMRGEEHARFDRAQKDDELEIR